MQTRAAVGLLFLFALASCGGACAGRQARENVLLPTMRATWPRIAENVDRGAPDARVAAERDRMTAALEAGDIPSVLAVDWPALRASAVAGIAEMQRLGEIAPGVAVSLVQRLDQFERSLQALRNGGGR